MRKMVLMLGLMVAAGTVAWGQTAIQQPDGQGVYVVFGDVKPPKLVHVNAATVPAGTALPEGKYICTLSMVVGADGIPTNIEVVEKRNSSLDDAAIEAIKSAQFEPATLKGKPVPVMTFAWVPFLDVDHPAVPLAGPLDKIPDMTAPKPLNHVDAEFSNEARRKHHSGTVLATMVVTETGGPADARTVVPAGFGLDEQALKAINKYRFSPSKLGGVPVPVLIVIEVNFKI